MAILSCLFCLGEFTAKAYNAKYCGANCRVKASQRNNPKLTCRICFGPMQKGKTSKPQGEAVHNKCAAGGVSFADLGSGHGASKYRMGCRCDVCREGQRLKTAAYSISRRGAIEIPDCVECGEKLRGTPRGATEPRHKRCKAGKSASFYVTPAVRNAVYDRCGWACSICSHPVDRDAHYLSDWYPTLDHITPQSATSEPDHSPSNLRLAHRYCNLVRGNERFTDAEVAQFAGLRR